MKKAIAMPCGARRSVCAVSLYAISALEGLEDVEVFIADTEDVTLWSDEGCRGALEVINARTKLHYLRTTRKSAGQNRTELYRDALERLDDETALLTLDDDCVLPETFLLESEANFEAAPPDWGFICHYSMDVLNPNRETAVLAGARPTLTHQDAWIGQANYNERLRTSYDACGVAIWFRVGALRPLLDDIMQMCAYYTCVEDGLTCIPVSSQHPCFAAVSPWVRHYRTLESSRTYKDTTRLEQAAGFAELSRRGYMVGGGRKLWLEEMAKCGHTTNGEGFSK